MVSGQGVEPRGCQPGARDDATLVAKSATKEAIKESEQEAAKEELPALELACRRPEPLRDHLRAVPLSDFAQGLFELLLPLDACLDQGGRLLGEWRHRRALDACEVHSTVATEEDGPITSLLLQTDACRGFLDNDEVVGLDEVLDDGGEI